MTRDMVRDRSKKKIELKIILSKSKERGVLV
jgi:hypothetical protein